MLREEFKTGIYQHHNNKKLYFANELRENHSSGELAVCYDALYPGSKRGYWKPLSEFREIMVLPNLPPFIGFTRVPRFKLILSLPAEKAQMILPGTLFRIPGLNDPTHKVSEIILEPGGIIAILETIPDGIRLRFGFDYLLNGQFLLCK